MAKRKQPLTKQISNRRARFDYALESEYVAGIALSGRETKALRLGHGHIKGAYVTLKGGEVWLINATITGFNGVNIDESEQTRARKLLLNKKEISQLEEAKARGRTIVPLDILTGGRYVKVRIAAGRGKKHYDKRQVLKERNQNREIKRQLKKS